MMVMAIGCTALHSQLLEPRPAEPDVTRLALEAVSSALPSGQRSAVATLDWDRPAVAAHASFDVQPPDGLRAELTDPFGSPVLSVLRDASTYEVVVANPQVRKILDGVEQLLALWLLGACDAGPVWQGFNAVAVDCAATGPDEGWTWRIWVDLERGTRTRGELLRGDRLVADYTCDASGRCILQNPTGGYALRIHDSEPRD